MLSRTDGDQFVALIDESAAAGTDFGQQYRIRTVVANTLLSSEIMGNTDFPQIYMERSTIFVLSSGAWGTLLKATKADDWQLFIMSKEDVFSAHLALLPPQFVHTAALQPVNLPHTVLSDPTALYLHKIQRKCPNIINSVVGGTVRLL